MGHLTFSLFVISSQALATIVVILASEATANPALLPGDPRLENHHGHQHEEHHHHHDHHHHHHDHEHEHQAQVQQTPYVRNDDGSYSYRYDLGDGTFAYATADASGAVIGGYGYRSPDGEDIAIEYTASGNLGYRPTGAHLPAAITTYSNDFDDESASTYSDDDYYDADADRFQYFIS